MRKLGKANIRAFIFFTIIVISIVTIFIFSVIKVLSYDKQKYEVSASSFVYDKDYHPISLSNDGVIFKNWTGDYYFTINGKDTKYNLGRETVIFDLNNYIMYIYGDVYQVFLDAKVIKKSGQTRVVRTTAPSFYKLADRKYLIVDKTINDSKGILTAKNYLLIDIDKSGNALLINNEMNVKTINSIVLKTNDYLFDVKNEKLKLGDKVIDLKRIIGSTNQYKEEQENSNKNNTGGSSNNNNNQGSNNNGSSGNNSTGSSNEPLVFQRKLGIRTLIPNITYLDVNYFVDDPLNEYTSTFLIVGDSSGKNQKIQIDKNNTSYRIRNLIPNTEYNISIGYASVDKSNNIASDQIQDVIKIRTLKPDFKLSITKVSNNKIYFNLKLDKNYCLESGVIALYSDNNKINTININPAVAITSDGWSSSFDIGDLGYEVTLKLENAIYNGIIINTDVQTKYINY